MVNGREKFFENIGCFDLQAAGVDARMAASDELGILHISIFIYTDADVF